MNSFSYFFRLVFAKCNNLFVFKYRTTNELRTRRAQDWRSTIETIKRYRDKETTEYFALKMSARNEELEMSLE